ncbi:MAG TPA: ferritin-like domain-containing protein, partial [Sphingomonas sp.]
NGDASNIVPLNENGLAYSRTSQQVHNIAYLTPDAASKGGFFPNGTNNPNSALTMSGDASSY